MEEKESRRAGIRLSQPVGLGGGLAFRMHRFTGLALAVFLFLHILWAVGAATVPALIDWVSGPQAVLAARLAEVPLLFCLCFHGLNGLRIILLDLVLPQHWRAVSARRSFQAVLLAAVVVWLPATAWLLSRLPPAAGGG